MKAFQFPGILCNPCFPNRTAALRYWVRHQWRSVRIRLADDPGCVFEWLAIVVIVGGALLLM